MLDFPQQIVVPDITVLPKLRVLAGSGELPTEIPARLVERELAERGLASDYNGQPFSVVAGRFLGRTDFIRRLATLSRTVYFVSFMQPSGYRFFPQGLWAEVVPMCYDCWVPEYPRWVSLFRRMQTRLAFITARQSAQYMAAHVPGLETVWLPEAIDPARFDPSRPLAERKVDVLEFGRRWMDYHLAIAKPLALRGYIHVHESRKDTQIFRQESDFRSCLADARIAICFPGSLTHPAYTGGVETLTQRYLESMAAGCLLVGRCPAELEELFGYNPVIEADLGDPAGQIEAILGNLADWEPLRQRNLERLWQVGTWQARVDTMLAELVKHGY